MQIDARGMTCPKPVVLTLEALPKLSEVDASISLLGSTSEALSSIVSENTALTADEKKKMLAEIKQIDEHVKNLKEILDAGTKDPPSTSAASKAA